MYRMAMTGISREHRQVLALHFHERLPFREIGSRLGISEDAARHLQSRALHAFTKRLTRLGFYEN
jgi:DNA-directed RNA polymerase specialized sigma24 family protein